MITHIECLPRKTMEGFKDKILLTPNYHAISICNPDADAIFEASDKAMTCWFSDLSPSPFLKGTWFQGTTECFINSHQAKMIVTFIEKLARSEEDVKLFVNCSAGICRSGAVAQFAQAFSTMKDVHFASVNQHIKPNMWVYEKLIEVWMEEFPDLHILQEEREY